MSDTGFTPRGGATLLCQMLQDIRDFHLILNNGDETRVGATFSTDERIYYPYDPDLTQIEMKKATHSA